MNIKNKTALVTGATKGIGKATIELMIANKCNVVINYVNDSESANKLVEMAKSKGIEAISIKADISSKEDVTTMFRTIKEEFGSLDILVNNAAIYDMKDSPESIETFERIFKMNFLAQVSVTNNALKIMEKGKIVFVSSVHGILGHGSPESIAYSSMKAALDSYMKNLAKHIAPNILVNSVSPGRTLTPMWGGYG